MEAVEEDAGRSRRCCCSQAGCRCRKSHVISVLLLLGIAGGIGLGALLRSVPPFDRPQVAPRELMYLYFPGELLIRAMTFLSIPLVVCSLISGIGAMRGRISGKVGLRAAVYYVITTALAVLEGFAFVYAVRPGSRDYFHTRNATVYDIGPLPNASDVSTIDTILDLLRNLVPDNPVTACFQTATMKVEHVPVTLDNTTYLVEKFTLEHTDKLNILGISCLSILFGFAVARLGDKGKALYDVTSGLFEAIMVVFRALLWLYPLTTVTMMAYTVIKIEDPIGYLEDSMVFILTVLLGLLTHVFLVLPIVFAALTRSNPFRHMAGCLQALLTAMGTGNSALTLPVTMDCLRKLGINPSVIRYLCPIGATVNMDGLALYEAMACIFLATRRGLVVTPGQALALGFTSVVISIGAPAVCNFLVLMVLLFGTVGLPIQDVFLILPYNWFLNRFRVMTNVWSDCVGAGIVAKLSADDLAKVSRDDNEDQCSSMAGDLAPPDGAILTAYRNKNPKDWTVQLINESGDRLVVSKV